MVVDGLIVVCAVAAYDGIRMSDWHLAQHLSKLAPVLYVDPPSFRRPAARGPRRAGRRLRQEGPGLARLVPLVPPFPSRRAVAATTAALIRRDLRWATARLGGQVSAVLSGWPQFPVFGACGEPVRGYWAKDDFVLGKLPPALLLQSLHRIQLELPGELPSRSIQFSLLLHFRA